MVAVVSLFVVAIKKIVVDNQKIQTVIHLLSPKSKPWLCIHACWVDVLPCRMHGNMLAWHQSHLHLLVRLVQLPLMTQ